jgi:opacity protein-like surface antigen
MRLPAFKPATRLLAIAALLCAAGLPAQAQTAIAARAGTTGFGGEFAVSLTEQFGLRAALAGGSVTRNTTESGVRYEGKWKFGTGMALADFHPGGGRFRLSVGLAYNDNRFEGEARGTSGTIEINGRDYAIADIGTVNGDLSFKKTTPYFGVGWGTAARSAGTGLFFSADLGVMLGADARVRLRANCSPAFSPAQCAQLDSDLRAEEDDFLSDSGLKNVYPVLSFGIGYRF